MITTIIFDIGNVLADFAWEAHFKRCGFDEKQVARLAKATVRHPFWNEYDRGKLSEEEMVQGFIANDPEIEADIRKALTDFSTIVTHNDYAIPWVEGLRAKGYRCLYLSNFSEKAHRECTEALNFIPHMDGGILSYQEQVIKPMPEIYRILIDRYGLNPEECVFLDDTPRNLEGAAKFGIHTIHFQNQAQANAELRKLGVEA